MFLIYRGMEDINDADFKTGLKPKKNPVYFADSSVKHASLENKRK